MSAGQEWKQEESSLKPREGRVSRGRACAVLPNVADSPSKIRTENRFKSLVISVRAV